MEVIIGIGILFITWTIIVWGSIYFNRNVH